MAVSIIAATLNKEAIFMKQKFAKLIDIKSIVTLALTAVFCYLSIIGIIAASQFLTIFTVIVSFYFGTQAVKKKDNSNEVSKND